MDFRSSRARPASTIRAARTQKSKRARHAAGQGAAAAGAKRGTHGRSPEIIGAAARVFAERGYHGSSTQNIADVLGIRQASLYYYLPSKEAALEIVCTRGVDDFHNAAKAIVTGPGTAREKLTSLVRAHITPILDRRDFVKVFLTQRQFLPDQRRRRIGKIGRGIEQLFESVIREGMRTGEFSSRINPRLITLAILGMANAVVLWYGKETFSIEQIGNEFSGLILQGIANVDGQKPSGPNLRTTKGHHRG
jgi:TetR/AcrR family transcriptional regulator, cholesterol catabolism regulator